MANVFTNNLDHKPKLKPPNGKSTGPIEGDDVFTVVAFFLS